MKKITLKNYIILAIILIISIFCVLYINHWYDTTKKHYSGETIITDFVKEIKMSEIDNYIVENPNFIIYLTSRNNDNLKFEEKFKEFLTGNDLQKEFIFMDLEEITLTWYRDFISMYSNDDYGIVNLVDSVIIIENQKIKNILFNNPGEINIKNVKKFLKDNGVY